MQRLTLLAIVAFVALITLGRFTNLEVFGWLELVQLVIAPFELIGLGILWSLRLNAHTTNVKNSSGTRSDIILKIAKQASYVFTALGITLVIVFGVHNGPNGNSIVGRGKSYIDMQVGCAFLVIAILLSLARFLYQKKALKRKSK